MPDITYIVCIIMHQTIFMPTTWRDDLDVGVTEFNAQHEQIIAFFYDLQQAIISNKTNEKIETILAEVATYAKHHFSTEEKYFKKFDYPGSAGHIKEHENFYKIIIELKDNIKDNELKTALLLIKYLERWIDNHVISEDKKYSDYFNQRGLH